MVLAKFMEGSMLPEKYKSMTPEQMEARIREIKDKLGEELFIPGHHYQRDEVIQFADTTGDSLQLAQVAAANKKARAYRFLWRTLYG